MDTFELDPDCPKCLRGLAHTAVQHFGELDRVLAASSADYSEDEPDYSDLSEDELEALADQEAWDYEADDNSYGTAKWT